MVGSDRIEVKSIIGSWLKNIGALHHRARALLCADADGRVTHYVSQNKVDALGGIFAACLNGGWPQQCFRYTFGAKTQQGLFTVFLEGTVMCHCTVS